MHLAQLPESITVAQNQRETAPPIFKTEPSGFSHRMLDPNFLKIRLDVGFIYLFRYLLFFMSQSVFVVIMKRSRAAARDGGMENF